MKMYHSLPAHVGTLSGEGLTGLPQSCSTAAATAACPMSPTTLANIGVGGAGIGGHPPLPTDTMSGAPYPIQILKEKSLIWGLDLSKKEFAEKMDTEDKFASFRSLFTIPKKKDLPTVDLKHVEDDNEECVYLCGHSMGLKPKAIDHYVEGVLSNWGRLAVHSHFHGYLPAALSDLAPKEPMAGMVGALPHEVALMNGLTVNLHILLATFYRPRATGRHKIIIENHAFCSDMYVVKSQLALHGYSHETSLITLKPRKGEFTLREEDICQLMAEHADEVALILLPGVQYYTGQLLDIDTLTREAHSHQILVGVDLAHAVGNVPLYLHNWNVDFAAWCTYKYLNSGAGGIGGIFVHEKYLSKENKDEEDCQLISLEGDIRDSQMAGNGSERLGVGEVGSDSFPMLRGWWGNDIKSKFLMKEDFEPMVGADMFKLSNPPPVLCAMLMASLDIYGQTSVEALRDKQLLLTGYLEYLLKLAFPYGGTASHASSQTSGVDLFEPRLQIITPPEPTRRGAQLSLMFSVPLGTVQAELKRRGVVCDIRMPSVMRVAPVPLYNSFGDVFQFVCILRQVFDQLEGKLSYDMGVKAGPEVMIEKTPTGRSAITELGPTFMDGIPLPMVPSNLPATVSRAEEGSKKGCESGDDSGRQSSDSSDSSSPSPSCSMASPSPSESDSELF